MGVKLRESTSNTKFLMVLEAVMHLLTMWEKWSFQRPLTGLDGVYPSECVVLAVDGKVLNWICEQGKQVIA